MIAEHFSIASPGRFFIGGLIHDIGKLAMLLTFPEEYDPQKWLTGLSTDKKLEEERQQFAITHAEVGGRLLRKWNFPESLTNALQYHHKPMDSPENHGFPIIVQLADALSYLCCNYTREEIGGIEASIQQLIPGIDQTWQHYNLPWENLRLEMWYNWVSIERSHGSSILAILSH